MKGTARWYRFLVGDRAVADYHHSGVGSLSGFLLQDMHGAMVAPGHMLDAHLWEGHFTSQWLFCWLL
jgi:hypothetical protein